jgi:hypothetical protein
MPALHEIRSHPTNAKEEMSTQNSYFVISNAVRNLVPHNPNTPFPSATEFYEKEETSRCRTRFLTAFEMTRARLCRPHVGLLFMRWLLVPGQAWGACPYNLYHARFEMSSQHEARDD